MSPNQSLQEKYPHLEVSVLKLSEVREDNESFRIDSEYFKKEYLENEKKIEKYPTKTLEELSYRITNGHTPYGENLLNNEVKFITAEFIDDFVITEVKKFISLNSHFNYLKRSILENGNVIIAIKGKVGNAVPIFNINENININQDVAKIAVNNSVINIFYLSAFLNSRYGKKQLYKESTGQINPFIALGTLRKIKIPILPMEFQKEIEKMVKDSHKALEESKELYKKAEETLYLELGLDPKNPLQSLLDSHTQDSTKPLNISIRTLKESFLQTGRLDSEYYQAKYEDIETFIKSYSSGYDSFSNIINNKDSNFTPKSNGNYRYIELANISNNGDISEPICDLGQNLPTRARRIVENGDVIISSIEGSLSSCALITQEFDKHLVSTGFFVLNSKLLNPETLLVMFKSQIFQEYLKKFPSGTILCAINKEELSHILIPKIDSIVQEKIAHYIQESFRLKNESKLLLSEAKAKVESTIANGVTSK